MTLVRGRSFALLRSNGWGGNKKRFLVSSPDLIKWFRLSITSHCEVVPSTVCFRCVEIQKYRLVRLCYEAMIRLAVEFSDDVSVAILAQAFLAVTSVQWRRETFA